MKFLHFPIDVEVMESNLHDISDSARFLILNEDKGLFDKLDYHDDSIFLEPSLFSYFIEGLVKKNLTLQQILWGHLSEGDKESVIRVNSDSQGLVYLPNQYYLKTDEREANMTLQYSNDGLVLLLNGKSVNYEVRDFQYLPHSNIRICYHEPILLASFGEEFRNPVVESFEENFGKLCAAFSILKDISPHLYALIKRTNKEMFLFNGKSRESLAAMSFFGGVLFNTDDQNHSEVFFIEDLAHQCGHVIYYALTLRTHEFLKPHSRSLLKDFNKIEWEIRNVYGAFHGLFTYTTILDTLILCLEKEVFKNEKLIEVYARIGFYMDKFQKDLSNMNNNEILTEKGFVFFDYFKAGYDFVYDRFKDIFRGFRYGNQNYVFNFELFMEINEIKSIQELIEV